MAGVYDEYLPRCFAFKVVLTKDEAEGLARVLVEEEGSCTNGSSFAITADTWREGMRNVWLSKVSYDRCHGYLAGKEIHRLWIL